MSWEKEFEELSKSIHDRNSFDCGENELNVFIKENIGVPIKKAE